MSDLPPVPDTTFIAKHIPDEVDIIFCGGGTAASVIASRLSAAAPNLKILLLEAGPPTLNDATHTQPAMFPCHLRPDSQTVRMIRGQPNPAMNNRSVKVGTGQCVGGGSSVNFAMYCRGATSDYDDWERIHENQGWGSKDLIPLMQKCETYQIPSSNKESHGYDGPLKVSYGNAISNIGDDFLGALGVIETERTLVDDSNDFHKADVYSRCPIFVDEKTGRRSDVAHCYLYPLQNNPGLVIATGVIVQRVLFDGNKATGVEFQYNPTQHDTKMAQATRKVKATKLVVISAGTFGSPGILERSGIGAEKVLREFNIPTIVELDGVGENYIDHHVLFAHFLAAPESQTLEAIHRGEPEVIQAATSTWEKTGGGPLSTNGIEAVVKYRFTPQDLEELGPAYKKRWDSYLANTPDKSAVIIVPLATLAGVDPTKVSPNKHFTLAMYSLYPISVGSVHISSTTDGLANPIWYDNFFKFEEDVAVLVWAYKRAREIARRMPCYRGEVSALHPKFPKGSESEPRDQAQPTRPDEKNISWTKEDDKIIDQHVRDTGNAMWHPLGTCSMKPREKGGVVDSRLNVYGTQSLKVADLSICPSNIGANTYSTAIAIGERAAIIIAEDLEIDLR